MEESGEAPKQQNGKTLSEKKKLFNNSAAFMISQILMIVFRFVSKPFMIKYIGEEMLGIGGAISSLLSTLALAELGFHASVIYRLYKPLGDQDYKTCNEYMMVLKRCYQLIALFIFTFTLVLAPFLHIFLKDVQITSYIYAIYFISGFITAASYLFGDKLQLLYADKKDYVAKRIEITFGFVIKIVGLLVVIATGNYLLFVIISSLSSFSTWLIVVFFTKKNYPWLQKCPVNKKILHEILGDVKNLCIANFAGYVYFNTDNLVISSFIGAVSVTYFGNYTGIAFVFRSFADSGIRQIEPFIGQIYAQNKSVEKNFPYFMLDTFVRFLVSGVLGIPMYVLFQGFISWWVGEKFVLSTTFVVLLCLDFYLFLVHRALSDYITITGSYAYERNVSAIGALLNLGFSIILVRILGIEGVLIGTVISECFYWVARGYIVFRKIFYLPVNKIFSYILKNGLYFLAVIITIFAGKKISELFTLSVFLVDFIAKGILIEFIFILIVLLLFARTDEFKRLVDFLKK